MCEQDQLKQDKLEEYNEKRDAYYKELKKKKKKGKKEIDLEDPEEKWPNLECAQSLYEYYLKQG